MVNIEIDSARRATLPIDLLSCCPLPGRNDIETDNSFSDHLSSAGQRTGEPEPRDTAPSRPHSPGMPALRKPQPANRPRSSGAEHGGAPPNEPRAEPPRPSERENSADVEDVALPEAPASGGEPPEPESGAESLPQEYQDPALLAGIGQAVQLRLAADPASTESTAETALAAISLREAPAGTDLPAPGPDEGGEGDTPVAPEAKLAVSPAAVVSVAEETNSDQRGSPAETDPTEVVQNQSRAKSETLEADAKNLVGDQSSVADALPEQTHNGELFAADGTDTDGSVAVPADGPRADGEPAENPSSANQASPTAAMQAVGSYGGKSAIGSADGSTSTLHVDAAPAAGDVPSTAADDTPQEHTQRSALDLGSAAPSSVRSEDLPRSSGGGPASGHLHGMRSDGENGTARAESSGASHQAGDTPSRDGLSEIDRVRFVQRVARAFHTLRDQGGQLRLRLSPPELGALRLDVTVRDGALSAHLQAETPAARAMLLDNLPALRDRLAEQQIRIERFDVDLMDRSPGNPSQQPMGDRNDSHQRNQPGIKTPQNQAGTEAMVRRRVIVGQTQLNVVI